jgi:cytochrome c biogenesis protein CcmG, thiol:disulfide interchange protein DsbE
MMHFNFSWRCRLWQVGSGLLIALLLTGACSSSDSGTEAIQAINLADLPAGIGRGYPVAQVDTEPTPGGLLRAGEAAPDFSLVLDDGRFLRLSDLQGQPVIVNFWATWCGPCRMEMPELVNAANADQDLVVLAVDVQEAFTPVEKFAAEFEMSMPVVLDSNGKVRNLYRVPGLPTTYFVDRAGKIASVVVGPLTPPVLTARLAEIRQ